MFVFDLFEKKKQDAVASRFVGGASQDARVKNALDNAYRAVPAAKSPEEAALGYIDIQNSLNQKQDQALDQQTKTNQQQTKQINDLVNDMRRKEKDFRDLNAQIANMPDVTPQQAAKMAQDIEDSHSSDKGEPVDVSNVIAKQTANKPATTPAKTVSAPGPGASVSQLANYQQAKDQGAATTKPAAKAPQATPQATPEPTTSKALGQMATQLTQPQSRVYKAKQPAQQELPVNNVTQMPSTPAAQQRLQQLAGAGFPSLDSANAGPFKQVAESTSPADLQAIAQHNNQAFSQAWAHSQSTKLYFGDGQWEDLTFQEVEQIVSAIATDYTEQARPQVWQQLFTDHNYFKEFKAQHLSQIPLQFSEGDVIPMTGSPSVPGNVKAYQYALEILKAAFDDQVPTARIDQMKQVLFHDFQARIQQAPDGAYYLNVNGAKSRLPDPRTFPMEEDSWHNGQNSWSSEHDQWAKESIEEARLNVGDPVIVTAPNEFEGKTGEIAEFSPSGKFVIVNLYNYGEHSMHLSDVEYNQYADEEEIDEHIGKVKGGYRLYSKHGSKNLGTFPTRAGAEKHEREVQYFKHAGESVEEGWSNKMVAQRTGQAPTPYSVYIKGKEWKSFADDDHAENVANKLRAKFKQEGKDPSVITIAPTDYDKGMEEARNPRHFGPKGAGTELARQIRAELASTQSRKGTPVPAKEFARGIEKDLQKAMTRPKIQVKKNKGVDEALSKKDLLKQVGDKLNDPEFRKQPADSSKRWERGDLYQGPGPDDYGYTGYQGHGMPTDKAERARIRADKKKGVAEGATDYSKRRQRERDVDAGKPVTRQPKNPQTDYAKKRAKEKRDLEQFGESTNYWTRLQNERNTKIASLVNELTESVKDIK